MKILHKMVVRSRDHFLQPTRLKGIFLLEWTAFILLGLARRELDSARQVLVAIYPLIVLYLVACLLTALSRRTCQLAEGWKGPAFILALLAIDRLAKTLVSQSIPFGASIPIIEGWLHLAHEQNRHGSWLIATFHLPQFVTIVLAMMTVFLLLTLFVCYRYYVTTKRKSVWADTAFVALFVGLTSWVLDISLHGYVIDYIHLPGVVTADLKDILLTVGGSAFVVEALENPDITWHWHGWHAEVRELQQLLARVAGYSVEELRRIYQSLATGIQRGPGT